MDLSGHLTAVQPCTRLDGPAEGRGIHAPFVALCAPSRSPAPQWNCAARGLLGAGVGIRVPFARATLERAQAVREAGTPACGWRPLACRELRLADAAVCRGGCWHRGIDGARHRVLVRTALILAGAGVRRSAYVGRAACRTVRHANAESTRCDPAIEDRPRYRARLDARGHVIQAGCPSAPGEDDSARLATSLRHGRRLGRPVPCCSLWHGGQVASARGQEGQRASDRDRRLPAHGSTVAPAWKEAA
jgi:hypothetical protein